ncbi:hypothetical protein DPMN_129895 [Dreissena polymorpha]|uniref:Uncharacterized protein n=1 Tax=Dreissena polymorpha TaxID=45954 RepID=A0A9D4H204_DREPO|nr:hypothetical protein DPMN_129895 [Dreissena polymorpha]
MFTHCQDDILSSPKTVCECLAASQTVQEIVCHRRRLSASVWQVHTLSSRLSSNVVDFLQVFVRFADCRLGDCLTPSLIVCKCTYRQ